MLNVIDMHDGYAPKRGDILQTNVGNRRERTSLVVMVTRVNSRVNLSRFRVHSVRWWEIEPEFRRLLFRHAERHGGQQVVHMKRYPPKKKRQTFEEYMRTPVSSDRPTLQEPDF